MNYSSALQTSTYNGLPPIQEASKRLYELGGERIVAEALNLIHNEGLANIFGIRLLHKHNDVAHGELMGEYGEVDDEGFALVTKIISEHETHGMISNSWMLTNAGYVPIEFSKSELMQGSFSISDYPELSKRLAQMLYERGADGIIGPCLHYSSYVASFSPDQDAAMLEKTDCERSRNVVRYVNRNEVHYSGSAKTKWKAEKIFHDDGRITWTAACNCFCSVFPQGGHIGTTTHRYTP